MYLARRSPPPAEEDLPAPGGDQPTTWRRLIVAPNVALLGLTSLITDISSEMVASIVPLYLTARLGFTALQFGATDGLLGVATALTALVGALLADRWRRYREIAGVGYGASAASRLGLLTAVGWFPVLGWLAADKVGKGLRTGPRDALISLSAPPGRLGEAFGLHRAMDTGGALLGPLGAVVLLSLAPGSYETVFVAGFFVAVVGLAILWLFVQNRRPAGVVERPRVLSPLAALWAAPRFRRLLLATALLSVAAISDSFLFLTLSKRVELDQRWFPLLFVVESLFFLVLAVPCGRLADRVGAGRVLLGGQVALAVSYWLLIAVPDPTVLLIGVPMCLGVWFAATSGVLAALTSQVVPGPARTTGLAVVGLVVAGGQALAETGFGVIWLRSGPHVALVDALIVLVVGGVLAALVLRSLMARSGSDGPDGPAAGEGRPAVAAARPVVAGVPGVPEVAAPVRSATAVRQEVRLRTTRPARRDARRRVATFVLVTALCGAGAGWAIARGVAHDHAASAASGAYLATLNARRSVTPDPSAPLSAALVQALARPHLLVIDTAQGDNFERLEVADLADPAGPPVATPLVCERVDQRAGRGLCLTNDRISAVHGIEIFDDNFRVLYTLPLPGLPSRTRVAPNGKVGAVTSFVDGDAYNVDNFSTRTDLIDLIHGRVIADLESFTITKGGHAFHPIDENFWGVTFAADSDTFYATMRTGSHFYLIEGHVHSRTAEVLRDGVECPSISPDGTELVYKSRIDHGFDPATWRLSVLNLTTLADHPLAEMRSVDDQAVWLDNDTVAYGVAETGMNDGQIDVWSVPANGSGQPTLLVPAAESPVVVAPPPANAL